MERGINGQKVTEKGKRNFTVKFLSSFAECIEIRIFDLYRKLMIQFENLKFPINIWII